MVCLGRIDEESPIQNSPMITHPTPVQLQPQFRCVNRIGVPSSREGTEASFVPYVRDSGLSNRGKFDFSATRSGVAFELDAYIPHECPSLRTFSDII
ncbi:MAG: hypothetical protein Aurels2KO_50500 [Aureliella sp.]